MKKLVQRDSGKADATSSRCLTTGVLLPKHWGVVFNKSDVIDPTLRHSVAGVQKAGITLDLPLEF